MTDQDSSNPSVRTIIQSGFQDGRAPAGLSASVTSLAELCRHAMPDPVAVRLALDQANFVVGPAAKGDALGNWLALDTNVFAFPVRNLRHKLYARDRNDVLVLLLLSEGESAEGPVVFCSTIFWEAIEADTVKAAVHVTGKPPLTGARLVNSDGVVLRRVFWDTGGHAGVRGFMVTGPINIESTTEARAFTAFNLAGKKQS